MGAILLALFAAGCVSTGNLALVTKSGANPTELITGAHPYEEVGVAHDVGCVSTGTLGLVARDGVNPGELLSEPHSYREIGPVEGRACRHFVLAIIPFGNSTLSAAVEKALSQSGGDALVNVSASTSLYGFVPIYNVFAFTCTTVQGTAIEIGPAPPEPVLDTSPGDS